MENNPYKKFSNNQLILRDELAIDRTLLANERTVIAYLRGAVTLVIAGMTFMHFIENGFLRYIGLIIIPLGIVVGIFGTLRYNKLNKRLIAIRKQNK